MLRDDGGLYPERLTRPRFDEAIDLDVHFDDSSRHFTLTCVFGGSKSLASYLAFDLALAPRH